MGPDLMQSIITQMSEHLKKFSDLAQTPVILVSQVIRGYFRSCPSSQNRRVMVRLRAPRICSMVISTSRPWVRESTAVSRITAGAQGDGGNLRIQRH